MMIGEDIKKLPAGEYLLETGLLFEINRRILHPFGLALVVVEGEDAVGQKNIILSEGLIDYRKDPEGPFLGEDSFMDGKAKLTKFLDEFGRQKLALRQQKLGYMIQHSEFDYITENAWKKVDNTKLSMNTGVIPAITDTGIPVAVSVTKPIVTVAESVQREEVDHSLDGMSVEQRNQILRVKNKIHSRGGANNAHNTPTGVPCTNPVLTQEPLSSGGFLMVCDTCGATIADSDMVK